MLNKKDDAQLVKVIFDEEEKKFNTREVFSLELWINAFKEKLAINVHIVKFFIVEHSLLVKTCFKYLNENEYILFAQMLKENSLLEKYGINNCLI